MAIPAEQVPLTPEELEVFQRLIDRGYLITKWQEGKNTKVIVQKPTDETRRMQQQMAARMNPPIPAKIRKEEV